MMGLPGHNMEHIMTWLSTGGVGVRKAITGEAGHSNSIMQRVLHLADTTRCSKLLDG